MGLEVTTEEQPLQVTVSEWRQLCSLPTLSQQMNINSLPDSIHGLSLNIQQFTDSYRLSQLFTPGSLFVHADTNNSTYTSSSTQKLDSSNLKLSLNSYGFMSIHIPNPTLYLSPLNVSISDVLKPSPSSAHTLSVSYKKLLRQFTYNSPFRFIKYAELQYFSFSFPISTSPYPLKM